MQKRQMKCGAGTGHSDSAIPLNLQVWMMASVCAVKVRHESLSDEWICSSWKSKIKQNHLASVKAALQTLLVGQLTSLFVICPSINYVCLYLHRYKEGPPEIVLHIIQIELDVLIWLVSQEQIACSGLTNHKGLTFPISSL